MTCPDPVEPLETRIALSTLGALGALGELSPTISADGKSATYVDSDGDVCTVTTSKGTFTEANFVLVEDTETGGGYLQQINVGFSGFGKMFQGAKITVMVDQLVGDGFADVGYINAAGVDLTQVSVDGDLVRIDVGDANFKTPAIRLFETAFLGYFSAEKAGVLDFTSHVIGGIKTLVVSNSWYDAAMEVSGGPTVQTEKFGSIGFARIKSMIGGSIDRSGSLTTAGSIGTIVVEGNLEGGVADGTGVIFSGRKIGSLTVAGSIIGGDGELSGAVVADEKGSIGTAVVGGIQGGTAEYSGGIFSQNGIKALAVNGDIIVGDAFLSGSVLLGSAKAITVGGTLFGGPAIGGILVEKVLGKLTLGGADGTDGIAFVIVGGPLSGGVAIGKITVTHSLNGASILAGYDPDLQLMNPNVRIGAIAIGEDLIATDIVAGIDGVNGVFGDSDDRVAAADPRPSYLSSIASIIVGGTASGTEGGSDQYGILAERIGLVKIGQDVLPLGKRTNDDLLLPNTDDYRLREVVRIS